VQSCWNSVSETAEKQAFEACGSGLKDFSGHTLHQTATQWACWCGIDLFIIKNVGWWVSLDNLELYFLWEVDEIDHEQIHINGGGWDPYLDFRVFDSNSKFDAVVSKLV
jgi:hypothetical protein